MFKHKQNWRLIHCVSIAVACMKSHADICSKHYVNAAAIKVIETFGIFKNPFVSTALRTLRRAFFLRFRNPQQKRAAYYSNFCRELPVPLPRNWLLPKPMPTNQIKSI